MSFDVHKTTAAALSIAIEGDEFRYRDLNQACVALTGLGSRVAPGLTPDDCFPKAIAEKVVGRYRTCRDTRQALNFKAAVGGPVALTPCQATLFPVIDAAGEVTSLFCLLFPETDRALAERPSESLNDKVSHAIDSIDAGFWVYESATGVFETSRSLAELLAGPGHVSLNLAQYLSCMRPEDIRADYLTKPAERSQVEYPVTTFDGQTRWLQSKRRTIRDADGTLIRIVSLVVDITGQKAALQALEAEASTDSLTGLTNRRAFDRIASQTLSRAHQKHEAIGLVLVDLDGFKPINDRYGHAAGDEILRKVARRLGRCIRRGDTLARIGGDEFAILLRNAPDTACEQFALRVQRAFEQPFRLEKAVVPVELSTGLATTSVEETCLAALFERADRGLYAMKARRHLLSA